MGVLRMVKCTEPAVSGGFDNHFPDPFYEPSLTLPRTFDSQDWHV